MREKIKIFLKALKKFIVEINYNKMLMSFIELSILFAIFYNINLIMFESYNYFCLARYSLAIIILFALGYAISYTIKKNDIK